MRTRSVLRTTGARGAWPDDVDLVVAIRVGEWPTSQAGKLHDVGRYLATGSRPADALHPFEVLCRSAMTDPERGIVYAADPEAGDQDPLDTDVWQAANQAGELHERGHPARSRGRANRPGGRLVLRCPSSEPRAGRGRCRRALVPGCGATARIQPAGPATSRPSGSGHRHRRFADVDGGRCRLAVGTYRGCHSAQPSVVNRPSKGFNDTHLSPRILPVW